MKFQVTVTKGEQTLRWIVTTPGGISAGESIANAQGQLAETLAFLKMDVTKVDSSAISQIDKEAGTVSDPRQTEVPGADASPGEKTRPVRGRKLLTAMPKVRSAAGVPA